MMLFSTVRVLILTAVSIITGGACFSVSPVERSFSSSAAGQKRGIYGPFGLTNFDAPDGAPISNGKASSNPSNPMNPFLSMRPFLPAKPTFFPPMVDPNIFVNKKAEMLDNLFSSSAISGFSPDTGTSKPADMITSDSPSPGAISPKFFIDKKTEFLNKLFGQLSSNDGPVSTAQRDLSGAYDEPSSVQTRLTSAPSPFWAPILSPTEKLKLFTDKKAEFLDKLFKTISVTPQPEIDDEGIPDGSSTTIKPTIVPPSFWIPDFMKPGMLGERALTDSVQQQLPPQSPFLWSPVLSPVAKAYSDKKTDFLNKLFSSIMSPPKPSVQMGSGFNALSPAVKPTIVPPSFWVPAYKKTVKQSSAIENDTDIQYPFNPAMNGSDLFPFVPLVKGAPVINPTYFINKKNEFLKNLFHSLNLTETSTTELPAESTGENAYSDFVSQLFDSLNEAGMDLGKNYAPSASKRSSLNSEKIRISDLKKLLQIIDDDYDTTDTSVSNPLSERSVASADPMNSYLSAKDNFVENILTELGNIKNSMLEAASELIQQQKTSTSAATAPGKKKSGATYGSPFKMWGKAAGVVPTTDPVQPFVTKMKFLSQLFDTLTQLEKNMTSAIEQGAKQSSATTTESQKNTENGITGNIRRDISNGAGSSHLAALQFCANSGELPLTELASLASEPASTDTLTTDVLLDKSKRIFCHLLAKAEAGKWNDFASTEPIARSIKMAVHQGYQSLPPGTEEILQAGGGGEPQKQEGGGLKLQNNGPSGGQEELSNHHHHNHHH